MSELRIYPTSIRQSGRGYKRPPQKQSFETVLKETQETQEAETKTKAPEFTPFLIRPSNIAVLIDATS